MEVDHKFGDKRTEHELLKELKFLELERRKLLLKKGHVDEDAFFFAKVNAELVIDADHYYTYFSQKIL
jgi:hypothetical protein